MPKRYEFFGLRSGMLKELPAPERLMGHESHFRNRPSRKWLSFARHLAENSFVHRPRRRVDSSLT
jgi:hypothetical protein